MGIEMKISDAEFDAAAEAYLRPGLFEERMVRALEAAWRVRKAVKKARREARPSILDKDQQEAMRAQAEPAPSTAPVKFGIGKWRMRNGEMAEVVLIISDAAACMLQGEIAASVCMLQGEVYEMAEFWFENGRRWDDGEESPLDLISPWVDAPAAPMAVPAMLRTAPGRAGYAR